MKIQMTALALVAVAAATRASQPLERFLPESTLAVVSADDVPRLVNDLRDGELGAMLVQDDGPIASEEPFTLPDGEILELPDGEALSFANLDRLLSGRLAAAIVAVGEGPTGEDEPELVLLADFEGDFEAMKFLQTLDRGENAEDLLFTEEAYGEATLVIEELANDDPGEARMTEYWALVNGVAIEATSLERLRDTVDAVLEDGAQASLADSDNYLRALDLAGANQLRAYLNLESGIQYLRGYLESGPGFPPNPLGVTFDSFWASLALNELDSLIAAVDLEGDAIEGAVGILYGSREGVIKMLSYTSEPLDYPHWIPAEARDSSVSNLDFSAALEAFEGMMIDMSPRFESILQLQLDNLREQTGVDVRESMINNLGAELIAFSVWDSPDGAAANAPEVEYTVMAVPVRDPAAFQNAIKALTEQFAGGAEVLQAREFLDFEIVTPGVQAQDNPAFAYAFANGYLVISVGSVDLLERTLYRMGQSNEGLWNQPAIVDGIHRMPEGAVGATYYDLGAALEVVYEALKAGWAQEALQGVAGLTAPNNLPENLSLPYFMLSLSYELDGAQVTRTRILPKENQ